MDRKEKNEIWETHVANFDIHVCLLVAVQELGDSGDAANVPWRPLVPVSKFPVLLSSTGVEVTGGGEHGCVVVTSRHLGEKEEEKWARGATIKDIERRRKGMKYEQS